MKKHFYYWMLVSFIVGCTVGGVATGEYIKYKIRSLVAEQSGKTDK